MGNALFSLGSNTLDYFGYGVQKDQVNDSSDEDSGDESDGDDIDANDRVQKDLEKMVDYCKPLIFVNFCGQSSSKGDTDSNSNKKGVINIGTYLSQMDAMLRQHTNVGDISADSEDLCKILKNIANKRHRETESRKKCYRRLVRDAKRFVAIYKERAEKYPESPMSEPLEHESYWGTRQQLLSAKVICDWLSEDELPPMDPIFGVMLNPTAGRVGPGDSGWFHNMLYDNNGEWAHHSAVHDAFGYLLNFHSTGPGYNYMYKSFFDKDNPMAGQISGIHWWKEYVEEVKTKLKVIDAFKNI